VWSLGLVAAGFFVVSYSSSNGPGETLVQQNGLKVLIPLLIPLIGVTFVAVALWWRRRFRLSGVGVFVWVVLGLLAAGTVLGALTIGPFFAPVAIFLLVAITRVKGQSTLTGTSPPPRS
jgi:hypothetical protein